MAPRTESKPQLAKIFDAANLTVRGPMHLTDYRGGRNQWSKAIFNACCI
jgi:hypothetical protein